LASVPEPAHERQSPVDSALKKLVVETVKPGEGQIAKVAFTGCSLIVSIEPLLAAGTKKSTLEIQPENIVLWLGYYLVWVEPSRLYQGLRVKGYFKVVSQESGPFGTR
jgi:hypothetical protein